MSLFKEFNAWYNRSLHDYGVCERYLNIESTFNIIWHWECQKYSCVVDFCELLKQILTWFVMIQYTNLFEMKRQIILRLILIVALSMHLMQLIIIVNNNLLLCSDLKEEKLVVLMEVVYVVVKQLITRWNDTKILLTWFQINQNRLVYAIITNTTMNLISVV